MPDLSLIKEFIPFLIPILIIQLGLMIYALVDLLKREKTKGPKWMWVLIIVLVNLIGPVLYLLIGREE
jgi:predicted ABC-type exoprotein transport system permease subunit